MHAVTTWEIYFIVSTYPLFFVMVESDEEAASSSADYRNLHEAATPSTDVTLGRLIKTAEILLCCNIVSIDTLAHKHMSAQTNKRISI